MFATLGLAAAATAAASSPPPLSSAVRADTPPRGWNSYDSFTWVVSEDEFLENCQYVADNLLQFGYEYCIVDYLWYMNLNATSTEGNEWSPLDTVTPTDLNIDAFGRPQPALDRWPSAANGNGFKTVADKVHAMGLKFGVHLMRGMPSHAVVAKSPIKGASHNETCADVAVTPIAYGDGPGACPWYPGAISVDVNQTAGRLWYDSLYEMVADWGVDFVKNDCVFGNYVIDEIKAQSASIQKTQRPIVYSLSPGVSDVAKAKAVAPYVNMYRLTGDVWDTSFTVASGLETLGFVFDSGQAGVPGLAGKSWPDMDMLPLGYIGDQNAENGPTHLCSLAQPVQTALVSMWAIASAPLFFDGDCRKMDNFTLSLITNTEVLEVNSHGTNHTTLYTLKDGGVFTGAAHASQHDEISGKVRSARPPLRPCRPLHRPVHAPRPDLPTRPPIRRAPAPLPALCWPLPSQGRRLPAAAAGHDHRLPEALRLRQGNFVHGAQPLDAGGRRHIHRYLHPQGGRHREGRILAPQRRHVQRRRRRGGGGGRVKASPTLLEVMPPSTTSQMIRAALIAAPQIRKFSRLFIKSEFNQRVSVTVSASPRKSRFFGY